MAVVIQAEFDCAVVSAHKDCFVGSTIEHGAMVLLFDMRCRDYQAALGLPSKPMWRDDVYTVDISELTTLHAPIKYRFTLCQGYFLDPVSKERTFFTPELAEVSTSQHMSHSVIRLAAYLTVVCGVSLRNVASLFSLLFLVPASKSTIKRWVDAIAEGLPSEDDILKKMIALKMPTECHIDAYFPLGTSACVMVVKDDHDRILLTHETESENYEDAKTFLERIKSFGLDVKAAYSDYSQSFVQAIKEVFPEARFQADHFHTMRNLWKHLKKALLNFRRSIKKTGEETKDEHHLELAKRLWKLRWSLLKKPSNLSENDILELTSLEAFCSKEESAFIITFRCILRQLVNIFDHSATQAQARIKFQNLKLQTASSTNKHFKKISQFLEDHWSEATEFLNKKGMERHPRASNSESGMRLLRRLEKNHDGIRFAAKNNSFT